LNGITHNLIDLQVGGVSKFLVSRTGTLTLLSNINATGYLSGNLLSFSGFGEFLAPSDGVFTVRNNAGTTFNRLQLGGTTSSFPSIKRNGAAIDFRLADDSGFCAINTGILSIQNTVAAAVAVASTHKVTVVIGGTTYYLLVSNV
jgi:hypothetical protein